MEENITKRNHSSVKQTLWSQPLPLMAACFVPGQARQYIDSLKDKQMQVSALCELYYYRGEGKDCVALARPLLRSRRYAVKMTSALMFTFGSICAGNFGDAKAVFIKFKNEYEEKLMSGSLRSEEEKLYAGFLYNLASVLLHLTDNIFVELDVKALPGGIRLIAFYVIGHQHYLKGEYGQAVGVCETALALREQTYPVGEIYLHLMLCISYMNLHEREKATAHFEQAWELARPEGFIEPFAEHHGLLQGMIEIHLRKNEPELYESIIRQVYVFAATWRQVHNPQTDHLVADNLTTIEFTVAMLVSRGWSNKKIAEHLGISLSTVKAHIYNVYKKLHIGSRKEISPFMLK